MQNRQTEIEILAGNGNLDELISLLSDSYTQLEIDTALENAVAYSRIETAKYLMSLGGDLSNYNYQSVYYAAHNNEIEGLKFAVDNGVDINVNNGMLINVSIMTCLNEKNINLIKWLVENGANINFLTKENLSLVDKYENQELRNFIEFSKRNPT